MRKWFNVAIVIFIVFGLFVIKAPQSVEATILPPTTTIEGKWSTGTEVAVDLTKAPAPIWLQLLAKGVQLDAPAKICHPFRGGQFGWTADIRQLVDGKWVKLPTTQGWIPSIEGEFTACAQAPAAGTYALFGYYTKPDGKVESSGPAFDCDSIEWNNGMTYVYRTFGWTVSAHGSALGLPVGTLIDISYDTVNTLPTNTYAANGQTSIVDAAGNYAEVYIGGSFQDQATYVKLNYSVPAYGCTFSTGWEIAN